MKGRTTKNLLLLCGLCLLLLAPFLARPMHIDDPMFVWAAQHIAQHPLDFYGFTVNWEGINRPMARIFPIPPLTSYLLAGISHFAGWNEFGLHLAFLPISLATIIGIYFLAAHFCTRPALCVLLVLLCPAFWVSSTTLMCETPLLCLWVWSVLLWIWGRERSAWFLIPAAGLVSLCILTKFTALGLIPLLALHAFLKPAARPVRLLQFSALLVPVVVCMIFDSIFSRLYGIGALKNAAIYSTNSQAILNIPFGLRLIDTLAFVGGGSFVACLAVPLVIWKPWARAAAVLLVLGGTLLLASSALPPSGWIGKSAGADASPILSVGSVAFYFQFVMLFALAMALIIQCSAHFRHSLRADRWHDDAFLMSWMIGIFIFAGFLNWSINSRSILPMVPAICIMVVRGLDRVDRLPTIRTAGAILCGAALALAVTMGDYQLAATGKAAAEILPREIASITASIPATQPTNVWLTGHWGLQYYMQLNGFAELDSASPAFHPGDYVIFSSNGFGGGPRAEGFVLMRNITIGTEHWVGTADPDIGAGFYHSNGYALPFVFGPIRPESFAVVKVITDSRVYP